MRSRLYQDHFSARVHLSVWTGPKSPTDFALSVHRRSPTWSLLISLLPLLPLSSFSRGGSLADHRDRQGPVCVWVVLV